MANRYSVTAWLAAAAALLALGGCAKETSGTLQGYIEGEFLYMAPVAGGVLDNLAVEQGDAATSGQVLFTMNATRELAAVREGEMKLSQGRLLVEDARLGKRPTEIAALEAQLRQGEAARTLASKTLERQQKLFNDRILSAEELDKARSDERQKHQEVERVRAELATAQQGQRTHQVEAAESSVQALTAALQQAQWNLDQTTQTAPQAGQVFDTYFRPGEVVPAGRPVVALLPPERVKARAFIAQSQLAKLSVGTSASVSTDGAATASTGWVSFISPQSEYTPPVIYSRDMRQKLSYMIEISFAPEDAVRYHPGQPVDVRIPGIAHE